MKGFTINLLNEIYDIMQQDLSDYITIDGRIALKLASNGCNITDNTKIKYYNDSYYYVVDGSANSINEFFDVILLKDDSTPKLIIFLDYFKDINSQDSDDFANILGKSLYFNAIKKLSEIYILMNNNPVILNGGYFSTTASASYLRYTPLFIAGYIVSRLVGLDENDIEGCGIDYNYMMDILNNVPITDIINGIRVYESNV